MLHWSRTRCLRLKTRGLPSDYHKGKKAYIRRPSWHPSGPLISGDALDAGRAGTRRRLRSPPVAVSHPHGVRIPPLAAATAARGTGARFGPCHHNTFLSITATIALGAESS